MSDSITWHCLPTTRFEGPAVQQEFAQEWSPEEPNGSSRGLNVMRIAAGLVLLVIGAHLLVAGAVSIAKRLELSELVIGVTIVAAGTSLPEVMNSIIAAIRGERDMAVGNVVGSNLFNILCVLGMASVIAPEGVEVSQAALRFDIPVMIAVAIACLPILFIGHVISRWEGGVFLFYYAAYTARLVLQATGSQWESTFSEALTLFVIPRTVVTLAIGLWRNAPFSGNNGDGDS